MKLIRFLYFKITRKVMPTLLDMSSVHYSGYTGHKELANNVFNKGNGATHHYHDDYRNKLSLQPINNNCGLFALSGFSKGSEYTKEFLYSVLREHVSYENTYGTEGKLFVFTIRPRNRRMKRFARKVGAVKLCRYNNVSGSTNLQLWGICLSQKI